MLRLCVFIDATGRYHRACHPQPCLTPSGQTETLRQHPTFYVFVSMTGGTSTFAVHTTLQGLSAPKTCSPHFSSKTPGAALQYVRAKTDTLGNDDAVFASSLVLIGHDVTSSVKSKDVVNAFFISTTSISSSVQEKNSRTFHHCFSLVCR